MYGPLDCNFLAFSKEFEPEEFSSLLVDSRVITSDTNAASPPGTWLADVTKTEKQRHKMWQPLSVRKNQLCFNCTKHLIMRY